MAFSVKPILDPYTNKQGLNRVIIQVIYNRIKAYPTTDIKIPKNNWQDGKIVKHIHRESYNNTIKEQVNEIETRLLPISRKNKHLTQQELEDIAKGVNGSTDSVSDFIYRTVKIYIGKFSRGRLEHYEGIAVKIEDYAPGLTFNQISVDWLLGFEAWLRKGDTMKKKADKEKGREGNTVQANMQTLKSLLNKAAGSDLIDKKQYEKYKVPKYVNKIPDYLNEDELKTFHEVCEKMPNNAHKRSGYYFLLAAYAGYRISDLSSFDYDERVRDDRIILRADKNDVIVSIKIHSRLAKVLDYVKDNPLSLSEQKMRAYIKDIARLCGVTRKVTPHAGRHSFGMLLAANGFSLEEAARLLGDTLNVAKTYYRITNLQLDKKVMERLG